MGVAARTLCLQIAFQYGTPTSTEDLRKLKVLNTQKPGQMRFPSPVSLILALSPGIHPLEAACGLEPPIQAPPE